MAEIVQAVLVQTYQQYAAKLLREKAKSYDWLSPYDPEVMGPVLEMIYEMGKINGVQEERARGLGGCF